MPSTACSAASKAPVFTSTWLAHSPGYYERPPTAAAIVPTSNDQHQPRELQNACIHVLAKFPSQVQGPDTARQARQDIGAVLALDTCPHSTVQHDSSIPVVVLTISCTERSPSGNPPILTPKLATTLPRLLTRDLPSYAACPQPRGPVRQ
jgi:hypothetical protein